MEVGNGTAINVRNDPWLLDDYNFYMQSHVVPVLKIVWLA